jgi:hypothetical protein
MRKNILQSVSGGYDSTYLLIKNLENGDSVYPLYVHASCVHPVKQNIKLTVIKNMIQKLKPKFDNLHDLAEINIGIDDIGGINSLQPVLWLLEGNQGYRRFLLQGRAKVSTEWGLFSLGYDIKQMYRINRQKTS